MFPRLFPWLLFCLSYFLCPISLSAQDIAKAHVLCYETNGQRHQLSGIQPVLLPDNRTIFFKHQHFKESQLYSCQLLNDSTVTTPELFSELDTLKMQHFFPSGDGLYYLKIHQEKYTIWDRHARQRKEVLIMKCLDRKVHHYSFGQNGSYVIWEGPNDFTSNDGEYTLKSITMNGEGNVVVEVLGTEQGEGYLSVSRLQPNGNWVSSVHDQPFKHLSSATLPPIEGTVLLNGVYKGKPGYYFGKLDSEGISDKFIRLDFLPPKAQHIFVPTDGSMVLYDKPVPVQDGYERVVALSRLPDQNLWGHLQNLLDTIQFKNNGSIHLENIYFEFNKANLRHTSQTYLLAVAELLNDFPKLHLQINAYTDEVGSSDFNKKLARERGETVAIFLAQQGFPSQQITVNAVGEMKRQALPDAQKRCVEIIINPTDHAKN